MIGRFYERYCRIQMSSSNNDPLVGTPRMADDEERVSADALTYLQKKEEFEESLNNIPEDMSLYRDEFEKLYHTLVKSHESEERLVRRSKEILAEISR